MLETAYPHRSGVGTSWRRERLRLVGLWLGVLASATFLVAVASGYWVGKQLALAENERDAAGQGSIR